MVLLADTDTRKLENGGQGDGGSERKEKDRAAFDADVPGDPKIDINA